MSSLKSTIEQFIIDHDKSNINDKNTSPEVSTELNAAENNIQFQNSFMVHSWNGRFHVVPQGFVFPKDTKVQYMWNLWLFGVPVKSEGPYRFIDPKFDLCDANQRNTYWKSKMVMERLVKILMEKRIINSKNELNPSTLSVESAEKYFSHAFCELIAYNAMDSKCRISDIKVVTIYNQMQHARTMTRRKK